MKALNSDLSNLLKDAVVAIESSNRGTGFFIAPGLVATCNHVVEKADGQVEVVWRGAKLRGTMLPDPALAARDLALLQVTDSPVDSPCVRLDTTACDPFTECFGYGFSDLRPAGDPITVVAEGATGDALLKLKDGQVRPGLSGSPLLNLRTGNVCGIIKRTRDRNTALGGLAIPASDLLSNTHVARTQLQYHAANPKWTKLALKQSAQRLPARAVDPSLVELRNTVKHFWVEAYLEQSLAGLARIELGKESNPAKVAAPSRRQLRLATSARRRLPADYGIAAAFDDFEGSLLVLGAPGAGKTTALNELAAELIRRSEAGGDASVPVILNLSSWRPTQTIHSWVLDEVSALYHFPRHLTKRWLQARQLILLLDGLDETRESDRDACAAALNKFLRDAGTRVAICSRLAEYDTLERQLEVNGSIILLPIDDAQALQYLDSLGATELRSMLQNDPEMLELAHSPLLLNLIAIAYREQQIPAAAGTSADDRRGQLFDTYIDKMFRDRSDDRYTAEYVKTALLQIAGQMQRETRSVLLIENLQPSWLASDAQRMAYFVVSRWLPLLPMVGAIRGQLLSNLLAPFIGGAAVGAFDFTCEKVFPRRSVMRAVIRALGYFLIPFGAVYLWALRIEETPFEYSAAFGLFTLLFCLKGLSRGAENDIELVERLHWSWRRAARSAGIGSLLGILVTFVFIGAELRDEIGDPAFWWEVAAAFVGFGSILALLGLLLGGWQKTAHSGKTRPNQGMKLTMRNALIRGAQAAAIMIGLFAIPFIGEKEVVTPTLLAPVFFVFWFMVLWSGGLEAIRHYTLRVILGMSRALPIRLTRLLDYGVHLAFLQRLGGGFVFIHRSFLEHLSAKLRVDRSNDGTSALAVEH